jgi:hypothetical protein
MKAVDLHEDAIQVGGLKSTSTTPEAFLRALGFTSNIEKLANSGMCVEFVKYVPSVAVITSGNTKLLGWIMREYRGSADAKFPKVEDSDMAEYGFTKQEGICAYWYPIMVKAEKVDYFTSITIFAEKNTGYSVDEVNANIDQILSDHHIKPAVPCTFGKTKDGILPSRLVLSTRKETLSVLESFNKLQQDLRAKNLFAKPPPDVLEPKGYGELSLILQGRLRSKSRDDVRLMLVNAIQAYCLEEQIPDMKIDFFEAKNGTVTFSLADRDHCEILAQAGIIRVENIPHSVMYTTTKNTIKCFPAKAAMEYGVDAASLIACGVNIPSSAADSRADATKALRVSQAMDQSYARQFAEIKQDQKNQRKEIELLRKDQRQQNQTIYALGQQLAITHQAVVASTMENRKTAQLQILYREWKETVRTGSAEEQRVAKAKYDDAAQAFNELEPLPALPGGRHLLGLPPVPQALVDNDTPSIHDEQGVNDSN